MIQEKSCGAIIYKKENEKIFILLLKHVAGHWAFAKGHVENNETELETAIREIKEETNLEVDIDTNFRTTVEYSPKEGVMKEVVYFIATNPKGNIKAQLEEISKIEWIEINDAIKKVEFDNDKNILNQVKKYLNCK